MIVSLFLKTEFGVNGEWLLDFTLGFAIHRI